MKGLPVWGRLAVAVPLKHHLRSEASFTEAEGPEGWKGCQVHFSGKVSRWTSGGWTPCEDSISHRGAVVLPPDLKGCHTDPSGQCGLAGGW